MDTQRVIYSLIFPNGKVYVGQTKNFKSRMKQYERIKGCSVYVSKAVSKYGWENVKVKIEQFCSSETVDEWERFFITAFNSISPNGYNLESGGNKIKILSEETIEKLRKIRTGRHHTKETREKISRSLKGRYIPENTRKKLSEANKGKNSYWYGKHHTEETKKKMSKTRKKICESEDVRHKLSEAQIRRYKRQRINANRN